MIKVKNVRAGIVIIADAGLKLAPGETVSVDGLTSQMQSAVDAGLLARVDGDSDSKPKSKSAPRGTAGKTETREKSGKAGDNDSNPDDSGGNSSSESPDEDGPQGQLLGAGNDGK